MRRIHTFRGVKPLPHELVISLRDYRKLLAVARAAEQYRKGKYYDSWVKLIAALDALNKPARKTK
jgi:hypothetical protein